ncbi:hypothetical protein [Rudaea sp.]|uniref:hypothetical protein n=1 Tax=Rudaea sp. TaxID=2136325 RepID=UPI002ED181A0
MNVFSLRFTRRACFAATIACCASMLTAAEADRGLRFDSPGVLDLAASDADEDGRRTETVLLTAADVDAIRAAPVVGADALPLPVAADVFHCAAASRSCLDAGERKALGAGAAVRAGTRLGLRPAQGAVVEFVDWNRPSTASADGDSETHRYLGRLSGSGYHRIEVEFGHDAPGSFLVNPANGKAAFVHNAADVVAPSPDGLHLLEFNADDATRPLRVAALDEAGPRLVLSCQFGADHATLAFKGWHDAASFDLLLTPDRGMPGATVPLRIAHVGDAWQLRIAEAARAAATQFRCAMR